ncbi:CRISPR-associated protein Cas4 [Paludifilum halophilum]|uniref:CRISPR-associated exonuclease Cas4 n=1 Tax=Paludifilum halophilum TaxID=1642702 RepID=A0A235B5I4_9BACL|nr:CRISPR-associated protein Cas4 [Paludifilum halophilum]OYD07558.1 CRISPR-associated protein Cas4 [Paludifilum halophilum]
MTTSISGIQVHYYSVCQRKLWLFSKGISMENEYDRVVEGQVLHERSYPFLEKKEQMIDNTFKIDAVDGEYVREVKISSKMAEADRMQMLYYLYQLRLRGVNKKGLISYTKERKTEEIVWTPGDEKKLKDVLHRIRRLLDQPQPPPFRRLPYCTKCAYRSFCFAKEVVEE